MSEYHKIQTVYKRDPETKFKTLLEGDYSLPEFEYLAGNKWEFTEKVDGTNIRVYVTDNGFRYAGRTDRADIPKHLAEGLDAIFQGMQTSLPVGAVLYGEGYGPKIQNGGKYRDSASFVLFDVNINSLWLERLNVEDIADEHGIADVPIAGEGTLIDMVELAKSRPRSQWGDFEVEGFVARPKSELLTRRGERVITKIKCRDFNL